MREQPQLYLPVGHVVYVCTPSVDAFFDGEFVLDGLALLDRMVAYERQ